MWIMKNLKNFEKIHWGAEMFGLGDFWLETRVIIKMLTHPC